jgi:hypothetical protein
LEVITKDAKVLGYVEDPRDVTKFLPDNTLISFKTRGKRRTLLYEDGEYIISPTDKKKGNYIGDICSICGIGDIIDAGGCATCNKCNAQLKCGL